MDQLIPGVNPDIACPLARRIGGRDENVYVRTRLTSVEAGDDGCGSASRDHPLLAATRSTRSWWRSGVSGIALTIHPRLMLSMTNAPHLLPGARAGYRLGDGELVDSMMYDGLYCTFDELGMGAATETHTKLASISRQEQDAFSAASHGRAAEAAKNGLFEDEIVPVPVPQRKGDPILVTEDEGVRPDTTAETLAKLCPVFTADGTVTAGSSSQISDGACAVVVMSRAKAGQLGAPVLAEIGAHGGVADPDPSLLSQPSNAIMKALDRAGLSVGQVDLFEINEAFASVAIQSMRDLGIGPDIVNVNGGAIAMGHPIGASGARLVLHLASELRRRGGGTGAAGLCGGGGQGDALIIMSQPDERRYHHG